MQENSRSSEKLVHHPHELFQKISLKSNCPKCDSFYIDNNVCESCGYKLDFDPVGDLFGERSFYSIREDFLNSLNFIELQFYKTYLKDSPKVRRYKRVILKRFADLIAVYDTKIEQRKLVHLECVQIMQEYTSFAGEFSHIGLYLADLDIVELENALVNLDLEYQEQHDDKIFGLTTTQLMFIVKLIFSVVLTCVVSFYLFSIFI